MKVCQLKIENFRGIKNADLLFYHHTVILGDNNTGKSTVLEALDLVLGPDRVHRTPVIDEHDFYQGKYLATETTDAPEIKIEATIVNLNDEQRNHFKDQLEYWDTVKQKMCTSAEEIKAATAIEALRVTFIGKYNPEDDDFEGSTYYARSLNESEQPVHFYKRDKQICGFLYLRGIRTGSRALSLEKGSLLDIILRIKELRPQMWEKIITPLSTFEVATDKEAGIAPILQSLESAMRKFVPREWGVSPQLKVSNLTRDSLRKIITAFLATGDGEHTAPFYRQGAGTLNLLVLAMLYLIAEEKQNVIFAMEEPETAIPPYTQKRIIHEIHKLSAQSFFTSHSPYVIEEFPIEGTCMLARNNTGELVRLPFSLPKGIKDKNYKQDFRKRFSEGLLSRRVLICEGATELSAFPAIMRKLADLNPSKYMSLEVLGVSAIDAGSDSQVEPLAKLYKSLGKEVYALCDLQTDTNKRLIEEQTDKLFMHGEKGFENLVVKNTTKDALIRYYKTIDWPTHLATKFPKPEDDIENAISHYFRDDKGNGRCTEFLLQCDEAEIPEWIKTSCIDLKNSCLPPEIEEDEKEKGESIATTTPATAVE